MKPTPRHIRRVYLILLLLNTLAASLIWGINTLFLLDAGLSNTQAFAANAFFTLGQVIFEVPTGIIADSLGRRTSYLLGTVTLALSTFMYFFAWHIHAPFWFWAATSMLLGLGFTFFSGATEAWLVDSLKFAKSKTTLESIFAKGQIVGGAAMLVGSVAGGLIAQWSNLGVPYILRSIILGVNFILAFFLMYDHGFTPSKSKHIFKDMKKILATSLKYGVKKPAIGWMILAAPFSVGVSFYVFYAMQPYLLKLYGNAHSYWIAGLAAAIVAGAQIIGGFAVPYVRRVFHLRTSILIAGVVTSTVLLILLGLVGSFWAAILLLILWGLISAVMNPIRQSYMNGLIESGERATVLSFDSLVGSSGGVVIQPVLGKIADAYSYSTSYIVSAGFQIMAIPFIILARQIHPASDVIRKEK